MNSTYARKASASGAVPPVSLLDAVDVLFICNPFGARHIFDPPLSNLLTIATAMLCELLKRIV